MDRRYRVLVLDGAQAAALAVVRSLGRRGHHVDVGGRTSRPLSATSRFCRNSFTYPDPLVDEEAFVAAVARQVQSSGYDLVIPITDDTVQPLAAHRCEFESHTCLAIADDDALATFFDKTSTILTAATLGVPTPEHLTVRTVDDVDEARLARLGLPVVIKPARSIQSLPGDVRTKLTVRYATSRESLLRQVHRLLDYGPVSLQSYFAGRGVGVELLCDHGEVVHVFQHERLHELPLSGGGSCLRQSTPIDDRLLDHARALMRSVSWHGVAMVEFKVNDFGQCSLMEVNGRFWGSLPLAVASGCDFPSLLADLLLEGRRPTELVSYREGVVCRKLSHDVFWLVEVMRRSDPSPVIRWPSRLAALASLFGVLSPRHRFDVQSLSDPWPGWEDLKTTARDVWSRYERRRSERGVRRRMRRLRRSSKLLADLKRARTILFLCYGNINRSVLAEHHLAAQVADSTPVTILSAGFHPREGRAPDGFMVEVAGEHGIDLAAARSRCVTEEMVQRADCIFCMDAHQIVRLIERYPGASGKTWLLATVVETSDGVPLEIADPYGGDRAAFEACFRHVTACTAEISRLIGTGARSARSV